jgi:hypothetical protein
MNIMASASNSKKTAAALIVPSEQLYDSTPYRVEIEGL